MLNAVYVLFKKKTCIYITRGHSLETIFAMGFREQVRKPVQSTSIHLPQAMKNPLESTCSISLQILKKVGALDTSLRLFGDQIGAKLNTLLPAVNGV